MNELLIIEQTYRAAKKPVAQLADLVCTLNQWYLDYPEHNYLHPCVIDGLAALVCQRELSQINAQAYAELREIAQRYEIFLKEDKRCQDLGHQLINRRKNIGLVLSFCLGMIASSRLVTAGELIDPSQQKTMTANLVLPQNPLQEQIETAQLGDKVVHLSAKLPKADEVLDVYGKSKPISTVVADAELKIKNFLLTTYKPEAGDPAYVLEDLAEIAHYYAKFPQVIDLISELQQKKLVLKFKSNNWQSQAWGNQFLIDSVNVSFDTRVAAQLLDKADCVTTPSCTISPADALLHELLHAKLMLLDSKHFIGIGGMQSSGYLSEHENEVIAGENVLYNQMNQADGLSRPIRHAHTGTLFHVNCAACQPDQLVANN